MPASPYADLPRPLAIVCNDAGAANVIFFGLRNQPGDIRVWATGPAVAIAKKCNLSNNVASAQDALDGAAMLISGTGWSSDVEHDARRLARALGIPSIAVLDHWVNYPDRFERKREIVHPDRWWVSDGLARVEAEKHFPANRIDLVPNHYLEAQLSGILPVGEVISPNLLYILEPARADWGAGRPGEFQALDYFVDRLPYLGLPHDVTIRLRPHPSDPPGKYQRWAEDNGALRIVFDTASDISSSISEARWVAGCESFGLALALDAGRTVFCTLPPNAPSCRLPHHKLIHLRAMETAD